MPYKDKVQQQEYLRRHYLKNKERYRKSSKNNRTERDVWFRELKSKQKCLKCSISDYRCLDFHHRKQEEKDFCICEGVKCGFGVNRILAEMSKCDVLCANCHRINHAKDRVAVYFRKWIGKNIEWLRNFKQGLHCVDCNINDERVLDFHHLGIKTNTVCNLVFKGCSVERLLEEIAKCEVLCCNCHRIRHDGNIWIENSKKCPMSGTGNHLLTNIRNDYHFQG